MPKKLDIKIRETKELWPHFVVFLVGEMYCLCWGNYGVGFGEVQGWMSQGAVDFFT